jgi:hypothetical protein
MPLVKTTQIRLTVLGDILITETKTEMINFSFADTKTNTLRFEKLKLYKYKNNALTKVQRLKLDIL